MDAHLNGALAPGSAVPLSTGTSTDDKEISDGDKLALKTRVRGALAVLTGAAA